MDMDRRILGGSWKGQRLSLAPQTPCRPTLSIHRERLFGWLQPFIRGANCLDLFTGTGALGLESASRGAEFVRLIERHRPQAEQLRTFIHIARGIRGEVEVCCEDALHVLKQTSDRVFDVVYSDPPFTEDYWSKVEAKLLENGWVRPGGFLFREIPANYPELVLAKPWKLYKEKKAKSLFLQLYRYCP